MTAPSHAGQVMVYEVATGAALSRWPVDARELVASGEFTMTTPETTAPAPEGPQDEGPQDAPPLTLAPSSPAPRTRRKGR